MHCVLSVDVRFSDASINLRGDAFCLICSQAQFWLACGGRAVGSGGWRAGFRRARTVQRGGDAGQTSGLGAEVAGTTRVSYTRRAPVLH